MADGCSHPQLFVGAYSAGLYWLSRSGSRWSVSGGDGAIRNASFAAFNHKHGMHYAVDEEAGEIVSLRMLEGGGLEERGRMKSGGAAPCFLSVDPACSMLAAANYKSGSVSVFRLEAATGAVASTPQVFENSGAGADAERQERPHAHCARFHDGYLYSADLGTDEVLRYRCEAGGGSVASPEVAFRFPAGQGPRHIVFHPRLAVAYVLTELGSAIFVLDIDESGLVERQRLSTLPPGFDDESLGGHIEVNAAGDRLYATNRGHDSVAVFAIDGTGELSLLQIAPTHRSEPRHFLLLEEQGEMLVAHEKGGLVVLELRSDGRIGGTIEVHDIPQAAFVGRVAPAQV